MAGRGSGIGMSMMGGLGATGAAGPSTTSTRSAAPGQVYGPKVKNGVSSMQTHHWLWILIAIELGILVALRGVVFKAYHGG
jgi:hypothetical protein